MSCTRNLIYLIPGNIEMLLNHANNTSNFGLYGLYLGVRNRRNLIYGTVGLGILSFIFNYNKVGTLFLSLIGIQIYSYMEYINNFGSYF